MTQSTTKRGDALATFLRSKAEVAALLAKIEDAVDNQFPDKPELIRWDHVGSMNEAATHLKDLLRLLGLRRKT